METTNFSNFAEHFISNTKDLQTADWAVAFQQSSNTDTDWARDLQDTIEATSSTHETLPNQNNSTPLNDKDSQKDFGDFSQNDNIEEDFQGFEHSDFQSFEDDINFQGFGQSVQTPVCTQSQRCKQIIESCFSLDDMDKPSTIVSVDCLKSM